jgi:hypothetical protein
VTVGGAVRAIRLRKASLVPALSEESMPGIVLGMMLGMVKS